MNAQDKIMVQMICHRHESGPLSRLYKYTFVLLPNMLDVGSVNQLGNIMDLVNPINGSRRLSLLPSNEKYMND